MPKRRVSTRRATPRSQIGFAVLALVALLLAIGLFLMAPIPPLQDFNEWVYQGALVKDVLTGHAGAFTLKPWPVPNALSQCLLAALMFVLAPIQAGKVFLALYIMGFAALAWRLCRRAEGQTDHAAFALLVVMVILNTDFWSGSLNFQLGLMLLMLHLLWVRDGDEPPWWLEALFAVLMFFTHALTLAMLAVHIGWRAFQQRGPVRGTLRVISVLLPALVLVAWYSRSDHDHGEYIPAQGQGIADFLTFKAYSIAKYGPYQNMVFGSTGDFQRQPSLYWAGVGLNALFALVTCVPLLLATLGSIATSRVFPEIMTALTGLIAFLILPSAAFGVGNISARFLVIGLLFALVSTEDWRGLRRYGAILACTAPLMIAYIGYRQAQPDNGRDLDRLAVTDPNQRQHWLFWHHAFQFRAAALAAQTTSHTRPLGFTTSILAPRGAREGSGGE